MAPEAPRIGFDSIDHVDVQVTDRPAARDFFVQRLGLPLLADGPEHTFLLVGDDVLGLHDAPPGHALRGLDHLALRVREWSGLRYQIERAGVLVTGEKEREESSSLFVQGPDGMKIELVHRPQPARHPEHDAHGRRARRAP